MSHNVAVLITNLRYNKVCYDGTAMYSHLAVTYKLNVHMGGSKGGTGGQDPLKNHRNIEFPSNIDPDPLKINKLQSQNSMLGHHGRASETPFKWGFTGRPMMAHLK